MFSCFDPYGLEYGVCLVDPNVPEPGVGGGRQRQDHRQLK